MSRRALWVPILLALLLAGCSRSESTEGPDRGEYDGGAGIALALRNDADIPADVVLRAVDRMGAELARIEQRVEPGSQVEKWWSTPRGLVVAHLSVTWSSAAGSASHAVDEQRTDTNACPTVTRLAWTIRQMGEAVGYTYDGGSCVDAS